MYRIFVLLVLFFISLFIYFDRQDRDLVSSEISLTRKSHSLEENKVLGEKGEGVEKSEQSVSLDKGAENSDIKSVSMSKGDEELLKLRDFHSYLRYKDRLQGEGGSSALRVDAKPALQKQIAKERVAVRLMDRLREMKN